MPYNGPEPVVALPASGLSIKEIADRLCISPKTVESQDYKIMENLGADSLADLTKIAIMNKLIEPLKNRLSANA
jgi:DNA-binding NarL/FixJ family response regulator